MLGRPFVEAAEVENMQAAEADGVPRLGIRKGPMAERAWVIVVAVLQPRQIWLHDTLETSKTTFLIENSFWVQKSQNLKHAVQISITANLVSVLKEKNSKMKLICRMLLLNCTFSNNKSYFMLKQYDNNSPPLLLARIWGSKASGWVCFALQFPVSKYASRIGEIKFSF